MYILKNAWKSIRRAKVRSILTGLIALVIAVSACLALSIRESAVKTKEDTLAALTITATLSVDRAALMQQVGATTGGDRSSRQEALQGIESLTLDELNTYATASTVRSFYYRTSASLDAGDAIEPVDSGATFSRPDSSSGSSGDSGNSGSSGNPGNSGNSGSGAVTVGGKGGPGRMGSQGDFTVLGCSSDASLTEFVSGDCAIASGALFDTATTDKVCVINQELATLNDLSVGSSIVLQNPNNSEETIPLSVVGIYTAVGEESATAGFSTATDTANRIYMSYPALQAILDTSKATAEAAASATTPTTSTDTSTASTDTSTAIRGQLTGTYVFADEADYNTFCTEVRTLGLSDTYTVSSSDLSSFEASLTPLENLSTMATWFLLVVFAIGAIILVVLNVFSIRERKYEIGVLTAIGMKKRKVALQFLCESFTITLCAILLGAIIGAATSVPVTNALLARQIESNTAASQSVSRNFGRDTAAAPDGGMGSDSNMPFLGSASGSSDNSAAGGGKSDFFSGMRNATVNYVSAVSYATDLTVILELIGVGLLLTLVASLVTMSAILRFEPLKILNNRE